MRLLTSVFDALALFSLFLFLRLIISFIYCLLVPAHPVLSSGSCVSVHQYHIIVVACYLAGALMMLLI